MLTLEEAGGREQEAPPYIYLQFPVNLIILKQKSYLSVMGKFKIYRLLK